MSHCPDQPAWLYQAWLEFGERERAGSTANPRIKALFADAGHPQIASDEVAWCAAFVSACIERAGLPSTRSLLARSYLDWGEPCDATRPGTVAVFSRGDDPASGHVGFVLGEAPSALIVLGGNQSDAVTVAAFPKSRVLSLRWPRTQSSLAAPRASSEAETADQAASAGSDPLFEQALVHVLEMEGGYTNDPADPGGPTNQGITLADYARHEGVAVSAANRQQLIDALKAIPRAKVRAIYHDAYWVPGACTALPPAFAFFHFDTGVNMGIGTAARMLQTALGVAVDGEIGPETIAAAHQVPAARSLAAYAELRRRRYRSLETFPRFGRGWLARVDTTLSRAIALASTLPHKGKPDMAHAQPETSSSQVPSNPAGAQPKWWGQSLTVWGAVVTGLAAVLPALGPALGLEISTSTVHTTAGQIEAVVQAVMGLAGTAAAIFGRIRARQPLEQRAITFRV